jgi:hypothetical protein
MTMTPPRTTLLTFVGAQDVTVQTNLISTADFAATTN